MVNGPQPRLTPCLLCAAEQLVVPPPVLPPPIVPDFPAVNGGGGSHGLHASHGGVQPMWVDGAGTASHGKKEDPLPRSCLSSSSRHAPHP